MFFFFFFSLFWAILLCFATMMCGYGHLVARLQNVKCKYLGKLDKLMDKLTEEAFDQCTRSYYA